MLTNAQAREAKPRSTRYELTCDGLPGFFLRVLPTGKKVFFARYRDTGGKDRRHRLGPMGPGYGVEEARREAMAILARREPPGSEYKQSPASQTPIAAPAVGPKSPTLSEFACRFDQEHVAMYLKPQTRGHYRRSLRRIILPALGDRRLDDITPADLQRLHNSLRATPGAANLARAVLSCMFTKAEEWEVTARRNPAAKVKCFEQNAIERFLSPDEREALERALLNAGRTPAGKPGHVGRDGIWAIRLLMLTGMRRDEVRDLRWEHVDWRQRFLRLPDSKTGKRDVVVSDEVMALLGAIGQAKGNPRRGLVVCSRTGAKLYSLGASWRSIRERAGIADVRLHDLRHSVASDAINNGVPLQVVGKMLGHRNYRTTQRYAHIADTALREAVNLTSKTIVRAGRGKGNRARASAAKG
jgi:integrase